MCDRQNMPENYMCEECEPRNVDKHRAIEIQTKKREEEGECLLICHLTIVLEGFLIRDGFVHVGFAHVVADLPLSMLC